MKFTIVSVYLVGLSLCEAGLIPSEHVYPNFPNLKTIHHGDGATSYQNVNIQNFDSVPIPNDLQVDDGHEYANHHRYLDHLDDMKNHDLSSLLLQNYVDNDTNDEHLIASSEASYVDEHLRHLEHNYVPPSHYENYDHEVEYEYH